MPENEIPAMPVPGSPADVAAIRLEPATTEEATARTVPPAEREKESPPSKTPPSWNANLVAAARGPGRRIIACAIILSVCLTAALIGWHMQKQSIPVPPAVAADSSRAIPAKMAEKWEPEARKVLSDYLDASARGNLAMRMRLVSTNPETRALMPGYQAPTDPTDVVAASAFVPKSLPESFQSQGIHLMYYQRPNTLPDDALFRPIVPMRVGLKLDSPTFLEHSAHRRISPTLDRQNVCAFFKRESDGRITLDWPVFVQTRHQLLARFVATRNPEAHQVFRLMVTRIEPALVQHVYNHQLPNHHWYRIQCPGYLQTPHIAAVPSTSPAASYLQRLFSNSPQSPRNIQAVTAELLWLPTTGGNPPILGISQIICKDFLGLNGPVPRE